MIRLLGNIAAFVIILYTLQCGPVTDDAFQGKGNTIEYKGGPAKTDVWPYLEYCIHDPCFEPDGSAAEHNWSQPDARNLLLWQKSYPVWLRFRVRSVAEKEEYLVLTHAEPRTDRVYFYEELPHKPVSMQGDLHSLEKKPSRHVVPSYSFPVKPGETRQFYIRLENKTDLSLDFSLFDHSGFSANASRFFLLEGIFFGAIIVLLVFYTVILLTLRVLNLNIYISFLLVVALYILSRAGFVPYLLYFADPVTVNYLVAPLPLILFFAATKFARCFLNLENYLPRWDKVLMFVQYFCLFLILPLFYSRAFVLLAGDIMSMVLGPLLLAAGIISLRKVKQAKVFVAGWSVPIFVAAVENVVDLRSFTFIDYPEKLLNFAILIEFIVYSVYLGMFIRDFESEKEKQKVELEYVEADLERAREIHSALLPLQVPDIAGYEMTVVYRPVNVIGGDYYNITDFGDGTYAFIVADVAGHGLPAALDAARVQIAYRSAVHALQSPSAILDSMSRDLVPDDHRYISAGCISLDQASGLVRVSLAGHPRVVVIRNHGGVEWCGHEAPLLGVRNFPVYRDDPVMLNPQDTLLFFTDGFYDMQGAVSPVTEILNTLPQHAAQIRHLKTDQMVDKLIAKYQDIRGCPSEDDITIVALRRKK